jgi:hypothetical protein
MLVRASSSELGVNFLFSVVSSLPLRLESHAMIRRPVSIPSRLGNPRSTAASLVDDMLAFTTRPKSYLALSSPILAMLLISRSHPLFRSFGVGQRAVINGPIQARGLISSCAKEHENQMT